MKAENNLTVVLMLFVCCLLPAEDYFTSFAKGKWDRTQWLNVKSPRFSYVLKMLQEEDHIVNPTPDEPDEVILKKYGSRVYAALVLNRRFEGNAVISSRMSFDHRMAPLLIIAPELGQSADGKYPEFREHYEIVLYDQGINIWHHLYQNGKPSWYKTAYLKATFLPKKVYDLQVEILYTSKGCQLIARCDGHELGYMALPMQKKPYYVGLIACEGRNRFYDFKVKQPAKKTKTAK